MDLFTNQLFQFVFSLGACFQCFSSQIEILHEMNVQDTYTNICCLTKFMDLIIKFGTKKFHFFSLYAN
jgi:hypothetical protein